ncbi:MAG: ABC transporter permease subunit [Verrucomicrobiae bacterium]|nr:ABC transporter permease subunit [Verrucomicrobiae bacterium]
MRDYFIRRLLLVPITLLGLTMLVFLITRFAPGGPLETALKAATLGQNGEGNSSREGSGGIDDAAKEALANYYGYDQSAIGAYFVWLGLAPREFSKVQEDFPADADMVPMTLPGTATKLSAHRDGTIEIAEGPDDALEGWKYRVESPEDVAEKWRRINPDSETPESFPHRAVLYKSSFSGLLQGNLGDSTRYNEPVWDMMVSRFPISLYYGILTLIITYAVCLPLGILKAIKHRTMLDTASSVLVFVGYAIPGYVLGALLVVYLGSRLGWFPIMGFVSADFPTLSLWGKVKDLVNHSVLPLICYLVGSFAFLTMLMKNSLMDNLAADYVRTAAAKGLTWRKAVFRHAFRNSIIPIATTFGQNITLLVAGSILIEKIFDIDGFGLLSYNAVLERDYTVVLGTLTFGAFLMLIGNIISDVLVALIDPRVSFR